MLRVVVLISGGGSNLLALLERCRDPDYPVRVVAAGADRDAPGLAHAAAFGVPSFTVPFAEHPSREAWGAAVVHAVSAHAPDAVVLSGLMRLLPPGAVDALPPTLNTHPAYLPEFPGAHAVRDALAAGATSTGASVIRVDHGCDSGPVLAQERVAILPGDTVATLHDRIKPVERRLLGEVLTTVAQGRVDVARALA